MCQLDPRNTDLRSSESMLAFPRSASSLSGIGGGVPSNILLVSFPHYSLMRIWLHMMAVRKVLGAL